MESVKTVTKNDKLLPMSTLIFAVLLCMICFIGIGFGILFSSRKTDIGSCSSAALEDHENCPSQEAGLCPIEDTSQAMKMTHANRLDRRKIK